MKYASFLPFIKEKQPRHFRESIPDSVVISTEKRRMKKRLEQYYYSLMIHRPQIEGFLNITNIHRFVLNTVFSVNNHQA